MSYPNFSAWRSRPRVRRASLQTFRVPPFGARVWRYFQQVHSRHKHILQEHSHVLLVASAWPTASRLECGYVLLRRDHAQCSIACFVYGTGPRSISASNSGDGLKMKIRSSWSFTSRLSETRKSHGQLSLRMSWAIAP